MFLKTISFFVQLVFVIQLIRTSATTMENVKLSLANLSAIVKKDLLEKNAVSYWKQFITMFLFLFSFNAKF